MKQKQKKNKKKLIIIGVFSLLIIIFLLISFLFRKKEENFDLTLNEKRWIENNKNKVIDISIVNDIPIFANEGEGIILTFLDYFEQTTGLDLNKLSNDSTSTYDLSFRILSENEDLKDNHILLYEDNYVLLGKIEEKISNFNLLSDRKIGVLKDNLDEVSKYLETDSSLTFVSNDDIISLFSKFDSGEVDYIVIPRTQYLGKIISSNYFVVYNLSALYNSYVFDLDGNKELNSIITKKLKEWIIINYDKLYTEELNKYYFELSKIDEKKISDFKSRVYIYGYVDNLPYDIEKAGNHQGLNNEFLKGFEEFSGAKINYKKYNNIKDLEDAFNKNKVDIYFNYYSYDGIKNVRYSMPVYSSNYVILSHIENNITIDSFPSLRGKTIYTLKDTELANYTNKNSGAEVKTYTRINNLLKNKDPLVMLDLNIYNFYKSTKLKDYYITYEGVSDIKYNYGVNNDEINDTFSKIFQFYLMNSNHKSLINQGMTKLLKANFLSDISDTQYILLGIVIILSFILLFKKRTNVKINKYGNTKYIDALTSLKNRNYLIENVEKWDDSKTFPKTIIIIDLNRLKDVNNNFGYKEGDRLIKAAANILISNQIEKSEIIRTDGNEFLVYMVGYDKTYVLDYVRKLQRLFRDLPYEHGATLGYSTINDDIKEIEDAINEATLDMLTNKENRPLDV
ncbi:MAG: diguanylate cyclase [Tenericutes bacterium]|nr:GGDEF domain-containing protein [Bacilli bacterium]NLV90749.1 diguanylate cyclase [Mycoplasmatota bacterium]